MYDKLARPYAKARTTNSTDASFPSRVPTMTEPTSDGVVSLCQAVGGSVPKRAVVVPYGVGSDTNTFKMLILGWSRLAIESSYLWVPIALGAFTCTLTTVTGVAGGDVLDTEKFCDTIAITAEPVETADVTNRGKIRRFSPADDTIAWLSVPLYTAEKLEFLFNLNSSSTSTNALVRFE